MRSATLHSDVSHLHSECDSALVDDDKIIIIIDTLDSHQTTSLIRDIHRLDTLGTTVSDAIVIKDRAFAKAVFRDNHHGVFSFRLHAYHTDNSIIAEGCFFLITALLLTLADKSVKGIKTARSMTAQDSVAIGAAQVFATLPGISRSGSTISTGLLMGLDRSFAVSYSFILGLPAILAAGLLDLRDVLEAGELGIPLGPALVGMAVALVSGLLSIRLVKYIVRSDKFGIFAWYTLILGIVVLGVGIAEHFTGHAIQNYLANTLFAAFVTVG